MNEHPLASAIRRSARELVEVVFPTENHLFVLSRENEEIKFTFRVLRPGDDRLLCTCFMNGRPVHSSTGELITVRGDAGDFRATDTRGASEVAFFFEVRGRGVFATSEGDPHVFEAQQPILTLNFAPANGRVFDNSRGPTGTTFNINALIEFPSARARRELGMALVILFGGRVMVTHGDEAEETTEQVTFHHQTEQAERAHRQQAHSPKLCLSLSTHPI